MRTREREREKAIGRSGLGRMEKRFSPFPEPSETETARYQGCKEQAEDVNCLVTFPVQPEPWKWPSNEVGSCSDSRKHSNQLSPTPSLPVCVLSPRLFYPFPTGVWLPGTRERFVHIPSRPKPLSFWFSPLLPLPLPSSLGSAI